MTDWSFPWPDPTNEETVRLEAENARLKSQRTSMTEALKADNTRLRESVERIRELHVEQLSRSIDADGNPHTFCDACGTGPYPCPTIRALDGDS